jgi:hypothetical protein
MRLLFKYSTFDKCCLNHWQLIFICVSHQILLGLCWNSNWQGFQVNLD